MSQEGQSKPLSQREKIVAVASRLMSQKGYKGASIQEISDLVGIHKSTFYHYFKNKEELLLDILESAIDIVTKNLDLILAQKNLSPVEKLKRAINDHAELMVGRIDNVTVYNSEIRFLSEKYKRKYLKTRKYYEKCFEQIIDEIKECDSRHFKDLDTKIVTFGILGMCNWMAKWYKQSGPFTPEDIADIFFKMIIKRSDSS